MDSQRWERMKEMFSAGVAHGPAEGARPLLAACPVEGGSTQATVAAAAWPPQLLAVSITVPVAHINRNATHITGILDQFTGIRSIAGRQFG